MEQTNISGTTMHRTLALVCAVFLAAGVALSGFGPALPLLAQHIEQDIAVLGGNAAIDSNRSIRGNVHHRANHAQ